MPKKNKYETAKAGIAISVKPSNLISQNSKIFSFQGNSVASFSLRKVFGSSGSREDELLISVVLFSIPELWTVFALSCHAKNNTQSAKLEYNYRLILQIQHNQYL
jgi:hypothetical protein